MRIKWCHTSKGNLNEGQIVVLVVISKKFTTETYACVHEMSNKVHIIFSDARNASMDIVHHKKLGWTNFSEAQIVLSICKRLQFLVSQVQIRTVLFLAICQN